MNEQFDEELTAVKNFLCENCDFSVTKIDNVLLIRSDIEYLSLLSNTGGFAKAYLLEKSSDDFIQKEFNLEYNSIYSYCVKDLLKEALDPNFKKYVLFYNDPYQIKGYSNKNYAKKRRNELFQYLFDEMKELFPQFPKNFIIVPRLYYCSSDRYEFSEGIYHYITGLILKKEGYIVANEAQLNLPICGIPDLMAISNSENLGYFLSDIEYLFNNKKDVFKNLLCSLNEPFAIEIKRPNSFLEGENQLSEYMDYQNISNGFLFSFNPDSKLIFNQKINSRFNIIILLPNGKYEIIKSKYNEHNYSNNFFKLGLKTAFIRGNNLSTVLNHFKSITFYENEKNLYDQIENIFVT